MDERYLFFLHYYLTMLKQVYYILFFSLSLSLARAIHSLRLLSVLSHVFSLTQTLCVRPVLLDTFASNIAYASILHVCVCIFERDRERANSVLVYKFFKHSLNQRLGNNRNGFYATCSICLCVGLNSNQYIESSSRLLTVLCRTQLYPVWFSLFSGW